MKTITTTFLLALALAGCTCEPAAEPDAGPMRPDAALEPDAGTDAGCLSPADFCAEIDALRAATWAEPECSPGAPSPRCPWAGATCCSPADVEFCWGALRYATKQDYATCTEYDYRLLTVCRSETCR